MTGVDSVLVFILGSAIESAIGFGLRQYLSGYLPEKGKHLATREDFDEILAQLRSTTKVAEDIKKQTSGELWLGQERWHFKRRVYVTLLRMLSDARMQLARMSSVVEDLRTHPDSGDQKPIIRRFKKEMGRYTSAVDEARRMRIVGALILSGDAKVALDRLSDETIAAAGVGTYGQAYRTELGATIDRAIALLQDAASRDLLGLPSSAHS